MSKETEIERLLVRLVGDATSYQKMLKDAEVGVKKTADVIEKEGKKMESFSARLKSMASGMRSLGTKMSLGITAPITGLGAAATYEAAQFEAALSRMIGLVGVSVEDVTTYRGQILKLAGDVGKSPVELAKAMEFITGSGIRGAEAFDTLQASAKAGAAGLGETMEIANAATSAMNAYGPANLSASKAIDILVASVREGKAEAASFAPVFGQVLPLSKEMGVSFAETGGILAFLTRTTGNAAIATTQMRSAMTQLMRAEMGKKLGGIGWNQKDLLQMVKDQGLLAALRELKKRAESNGKSLKDLVTDTEGLMGALQLTGEQADIAATMIKSVADSAGDTETAFKAASNTTQFQWNKAMAEMKVLLIELGGMFQPVMQKLQMWGMRGINMWKKMSPAMKETAVWVAAVAAAIGPLLTALGGIGIVIAGVIPVLAAIATPMNALIALVAGLGAAVLYYTGAGSAALDWFTGKWKSLVAWAQPAIDGIKAALLSQDTQMAAQIFWAQLKLAWVQGVGALKEIWAGFSQWFKQSWEIAGSSMSKGIIGAQEKLAKFILENRTGLFGEQIFGEGEKRWARDVLKISEGAIAALDEGHQKAMAGITSDTATAMEKIQAEIAGVRVERDKLLKDMQIKVDAEQADAKFKEVLGSFKYYADFAKGTFDGMWKQLFDPDVAKTTAPPTARSLPAFSKVEASAVGSAEAMSRLLEYQVNIPQRKPSEPAAQTKDEKQQKNIEDIAKVVMQLGPPVLQWLLKPDLSVLPANLGGGGGAAT